VKAAIAFLPGLLTAALLAGCGPSDRASLQPGLATLARQADGFAQAQPGVPLRFPRDHGPHPDFRIEWWYLTANLQDLSGRPYGAQWTLFRFAARPPGGPAGDSPWQDGQVFMAHMALTTPGGHFASQRYARGGDHEGLAQAGVTSEPFEAWLDDWRLQSVEGAENARWLPLEAYARQNGYGLDLRLDSDRPLVLQGDAGFSRKHADGGGSYYYSQPFLHAQGKLTVEGVTVDVHGSAWLDREWSSQFLRPGQSGWDWFALHLESGEKLMLFRMRQNSGAAGFSHAALIGPAGNMTQWDSGELRLEVTRSERVAGRSLPMGWLIELPAANRTMRVDALQAGQWMEVDFPYWEGAVTVSGDDAGSRGVGYMELTGY